MQATRFTCLASIRVESTIRTGRPIPGTPSRRTVVSPRRRPQVPTNGLRHITGQPKTQDGAKGIVADLSTAGLLQPYPLPRASPHASQGSLFLYLASFGCWSLAPQRLPPPPPHSTIGHTHRHTYTNNDHCTSKPCFQYGAVGVPLHGQKRSQDHRHDYTITRSPF